MSKRIFDFTLALLVLLIVAIPLLLIFILVKITSQGPAIYWSKRVGINNQIFLMPKFRTMTVSTPQVATHLLQGSENYITKVGSFLRRTSLDELPQVWSVLSGDMSLVGPRPALFNQDDLVQARTELGIHKLIPGITGWAQINGRDELSIPDKVQLDYEYLKRFSLLFDFKILILTVFKITRAEGIKH